MLTGHDTDLCIIGAGPAGALLAEACASSGIRTLLVESGPRYDRAERLERQRRFLLLREPPWPGDSARDAFVNASEFPYHLNINRLRAVGGTTLQWIGMTPRLRESDFELATRFGIGVDWPISYRDLEPYYVLAERELGVAGERGPDDPWRSDSYPMPAFSDSYGDAMWRDAASKLGARLSAMPVAKNNGHSYDGRPACSAFATCPVCPGGAQYSADWHAFKAERSGHCTILPDTTVRRLDIDSEGRVTLVHASARDGSPHEIRSRIVVIAASAVETPRLLLLSRIGNPEHTGRHLMEHWKVASSGISETRDFPRRIGFPTLTAYHLYETDRANRGAVRLLFPNPDDPAETFGDDRWGRDMAAFDCATFGFVRRIEASVEQLPNPASRVTLDPTTRDCFGDAAPNLRFVLSEPDQRALDAARTGMHAMMEAARLHDITIGKGHYGGAHLMGTCRMSRRDTDGVADADARVHGTQNLYLAGSALFPTGGAVNPTLTIAALSLRLADHLREQLVAAPGV